MQTAEGLEACHQQNLIHGLLKPANLMITADQQVRILDLGIGCLLAEADGESLVDTMSTANSVTSGLDCASPESIMDPTRLTPLGDQYSLGCVLYYCLTGHYPFPDGTAAEKMMAHQTKQPALLRQLCPSIPPGLAAVVERLMQKTPENRFGSAAETAQALWPWAMAVPEPEQPVKRPAGANTARISQSRFIAALSRDTLNRPATCSNKAVPPSARASSVRLPNRQTLYGRVPVVKPAVPEQVPPSPPQPTIDINQPRPSSWEDRLGPIGIGVCAFLVCILAWLLTRHLF